MPRRARSAVLVTVLLALVVAVLTAGGSPAAAAAGPQLRVPPATLAKSLVCQGDLSGAAKKPVLLVPGTTLTAEVNFSWNYEKVFTATGRPWCAVTLPNNAMSDIQVGAEYVVSAIRTMHQRAGRDISVVGFSQGGMVPRWALKYWPDTRAMVDDVVGIDPSNHGTLDAPVVCLLGGCAPAIWQQSTDSKFLAALNSGGETFAGLSYTQTYTALDEVVVPNVDPVASSALHTGRGAISNTMVQNICPLHVADHLSMGSFDAVAYALVVDALDHTGPARAARIDRAVCGQLVIPGLDPLSVTTNFARLGLTAAQQLVLSPHVAAEPALAYYARG